MMKTLKNHTLIYDKDCPMCAVYSSAFIGSGMLDKNGREAFCEISLEDKNLLDYNRSRNEIALINHQENKVIYGLDSLLLIIGNSFPLLVKIAKIQPLYWFFQKLYKLVSFNRKQIIPSVKDTEKDACVPDFNLKYRLLYIGFVAVFSAFVLSEFSPKLWQNLTPNFYRELSVCLAQIFWQTLFLKSFLKDNFWNYLGNMMTVSLLGTLLLIPALFLNFNELFFGVYFFLVVSVMFFEHFRRCKILKLGFLPTFSWLIFRLTLALLIFAIYSK